MFGMLGVGLTGFMLSKSRVMYTGMACCAALCLFLKGESNGSIVFPSKNDQAGFEVLHLNLSSISDNYDEALDLILTQDADFISFQEVTPEWNLFLKQNLSEVYPFNATIVKIDPFGKAIYSKKQINIKENLYTEEQPLLSISFTENGRDIRLVSAYLSQSIDRQGLNNAKKILEKLSSIVSESEEAVMVIGDFNLTYWSNGIREFRSKSELNNSRRTISLSSFYIPYDHIFYSDEIECTEFEEIDTQDGHFAIKGSYQLSFLN
jgi:endonuclease/exonuclease/phosphatase (EEP) superfamily protein YafD